MTLATWLLRLLTWDGILPICILALPPLLEWLFPNNNLVGIIYVAVAITAFFIRLAIGARHIETNNCPVFVQHFQFGLFFLAIVELLFLDALMMAVPMWRLGNGDLLVLAVLLGIYLTLMAAAMYPGRAKEPPEILTF
jgi:hypothetical protein